MENQLFTNVRIFDGTGKPSLPGEVLVQGNRIKDVAKGKRRLERGGASLIDGEGATVMPGLVNCHGHISYPNLGGPLKDTGDIPPEEHTLISVHNAKTMLDHGFTAVVSAAAAKPRLDVVIRNEINAGRIPGPRMLACTPQFTTTGGPWDARQMHLEHHTFEIIADGPDEFRRLVRELVREGVDTIKLTISGDNFSRDFAAEDETTMAEDEIAAACEVARSRNLRVCAHARSDGSIELCMRHGIEIIHHANHASDRTIDRLARARDRFFVCPALGVVYTTAYESHDWGLDDAYLEAGGFAREFEIGCATTRKMFDAGIRVMPFGDYGVAWNPIGTDARDLEHFVTHIGFSPAETLMMATKWGGECFAGTGNTAEVGEVKKGYLADIVMVDGDPLADITLLQDRDNFLMIMKDGAYHKPPQRRRAVAGRTAAAE
jgi:imidazolonepropionase-like amidohydrolase